MLFFFLTAVFFANGGGAQLSDIDNCDPAELKHCVDMIPRTQVGLPRTRAELDAHCQAYHTGMPCMDTWIKRCLPTDGQKLVQQQIGGARAIMRFLCTNESALRKDFLKELTCWALISPDWSRCVDDLKIAAQDISERSQQLTYINAHAELCCARDEFMVCVSHAGRSCTPAASHLLKKMAWVLAQDVAACSQQPRAFCAAPGQYSASLLTALSGALLYQPRL
ncbi:uncharacterized protein [Epargyreus clarus]|uniref:uncharacterized protein n=1 Tax=Epargyreus clarus TaxID=520877 RepID=UPI003C2CA360